MYWLQAGRVLRRPPGAVPPHGRRRRASPAAAAGRATTQAASAGSTASTSEAATPPTTSGELAWEGGRPHRAGSVRRRRRQLRGGLGAAGRRPGRRCLAAEGRHAACHRPGGRPRHHRRRRPAARGRVRSRACYRICSHSGWRTTPPSGTVTGHRDRRPPPAAGDPRRLAPSMTDAPGDGSSRRGPTSATWPLGATARSGWSRSAPPSSTAPTCRPAPTPSSPPPCASWSSERTGAPVLPAIPVACSYGHGTVLPGHAVADARAAGRRRPPVRRVGRHLGPDPAALRQRPLRQLRRPRHRHRPPAPVPARPAGRRSSTGGRSTPEVAAEMTVDGDDVHAHRAETSVMLAVAPDLVHLDRLADGRRPRPHRRPGVPLHRPGPVDQRRHRPPVGGDRASSAARLVDADRGRHRRPGRAGPARETAARAPPLFPPCRHPAEEHRTAWTPFNPIDPEHVGAGRAAGRRRRASTSLGGWIDVMGRSQVEGRADRPPAQPAGRLGALHAAGHGRPRADDAQRGRVRRPARPGDPARVPLGPAVGVDGRRPAVRRAASRSPSAPARS